ncbi:Uncharacterised protein [Bordetella pertussis]|nr:Uncharacterised protein [Bordetella pertussis]
MGTPTKSSAIRPCAASIWASISACKRGLRRVLSGKALSPARAPLGPPSNVHNLALAQLVLANRVYTLVLKDPARGSTCPTGGRPPFTRAHAHPFFSFRKESRL